MSLLCSHDDTFWVEFEQNTMYIMNRHDHEGFLGNTKMLSFFFFVTHVVHTSETCNRVEISEPGSEQLWSSAQVLRAYTNVY